MATITAVPASLGVGDALVVTGEGFIAAAVVTVAIPELGISSEIVADAAGFIGTDDVADRATATLTLAANAIADETVTIDATVYTWKAAPTTVAGEVKVGATASESLDNLKAAINLAAGSGSLYGSGTVVHPTVAAGAKTATTLLLYAKTGGTAGNALASTETMTQGSFGDTTFVDTGSAATGVSPLQFTPDKPGTLEITATDGTNTATTSVSVFSS